MIKILGDLPNKVYLGCSGGVDSMAILDFLIKGKKEVIACYFNHGTEHSKSVWTELKKYCDSRGIQTIYGESTREKLKEESPEEYWRNIRYDFFRTIPEDVITCHHLDDCVETYLFNAIHGNPRTIQYRNGNVIRPFLTTKKSDLINWCNRKGVPYWEDISNNDLSYSRNRIRHMVVPEVLKINPGIHKVVKKIIISDYENSGKAVV